MLEDYLPLICDVTSVQYTNMIAIINNNSNVKKVITVGRNLHHIIPRFYFKKNKLEVINDEWNLVSLSLGDHFLVHYYLWQCCKTEYKGKASLPVMFIIKANCGKIYKYCKLNEEFAINIQSALNKL